MSEEIPKPTMRSLILLLLVSTSGLAQPDYRQLTNWYYHPDKLINLLEDYSLDVAVTGKNLETDSTIQITNNATTDTGVDVFWVHPTQLINPPDTPRVIAPGGSALINYSSHHHCAGSTDEQVRQVLCTPAIVRPVRLPFSIQPSPTAPALRP
jgi:hypothetical protein